jgi:hypothetical protein
MFETWILFEKSAFEIKAKHTRKTIFFITIYFGTVSKKN